MKTILTLLSICLLGSSAHAASRTWTGSGGNNKWSTPNNWNPVGAPGNGDDLHIFASSATTDNDLSNLQLDSLVIGSTTKITGNAIVLSWARVHRRLK